MTAPRPSPGLLDRIVARLRYSVTNYSRLLLFWRPDFPWLYRNRYLRMDANVATNDKKRRAFHKDRYAFARDYLAGTGTPGMTVLDAACGTGYGSDMLKGTPARAIVGVDICPETIAYATRTYGSERCTFSVADVQALDQIADGAFDAAVSFETLEHVEDPVAFLRNLHRVLKSGGTTIISTPNDWGITEHHKVNFDYALFREHLERFFAIEEMYTQNSGSLDLWVNRSAPRRIVRTSDENREQAECFIAICRKAPLNSADRPPLEA